MKYRCAGEVRRPLGRQYKCRLWRRKPYNRPAGEERHSPFGGWRHHLSPASGGTITRAYCRAIYEESVSRCFILPPEQGEVRRSRIGGGERSEPISRMLIKSYDMTPKSQSRNADFISIARRAIRNPRPEGPSNLRTLRPSGRSILRTLFHNPSTQPSGPKAPSTFPSEPYSSAISLSFSLSIIPIFFPFLRMIFFSSSRWSLRDRVSGVVPR